MADRSIKVKLEAEVSQYTKSLDSAARATEKLAAATELATHNVTVAAGRQKSAALGVAEAEKSLKAARESGTMSAKQLQDAENRVSTAKRAEWKASQDLKGAQEALTQAQKAQEAATKAQEAASRQHEGTLKRLGRGVSEYRSELQSVAVPLAAFGAAVTAVGVSALKTGIEYNSLQQKSRAALTTLLGSAEAAAEQMERMDAAAKKSPFAKQVYITAQQQMLAFGIEAKKVVPYLEAINDTVAAAGGNSQTFAEIAFVMAQIQAAGKLTATDLMQLGQRGINAAEEIGLAMGKTGQQIKDEITAGTLDAETALDALAQGMAASNAGAAANVKMTWEGAIDRVTSVYRDLASELAEPLVGKEGGGLLVDGANKVADLGREIENLNPTIRGIVAGLGGVVGVASLATAGFIALAPRIIETQEAVRVLSSRIPGLSKGLKGVAIAGGILTAAVAIVGTAWLAYSNRQEDARRRAEAMKDTFDDLTGAATQATRELVYDAFKDGPGFWERNFGMMRTSAAEAAEAVGVSMSDAIDAVLGIEEPSKRVNDVIDAILNPSLDGGVTLQRQMAATGLSMLDLQTRAGNLREGIEHQKNVVADGKDEWEAFTGAVEDGSTATEKQAQDLKALTDQAEAAAKAAQDLAEKWTDGIRGIADSHHGLLDAFDAVVEANKAQAQSAAEASGDSKASWEDFYDGVTVSADEWLAQLRKQAEAYDNWAGNVVDIQQRLTDKLPEGMQAAGAAMVQKLMDAGPEAAAQVAALVEMSDKELQEFVDLTEVRSAEAAAAFAQGVNDAKAPELQLGIDEASQAVVTLGQIISIAGDSYGPWEITADGDKAIAEADSTVVEIDKKTGEITISGDNREALASITNAVNTANNSTAKVIVDANTSAFHAAIRGLQSWSPTVPVKIAKPAFASGGRAGLPTRASGGRLPRTGLGQDQILGVGRDGTPTAWVDDREWVINGRSSDKYDRLLSLINRDDPRVQGLAALASGGRVARDDRVAQLLKQDKQDVEAAKAQVKQRRRAENAAQSSYNSIDGKKENQAAKKAAKKRLDDAKKATKAAEKELKEARDQVAARRKELDELRSLEQSLTVDVRRGELQAQGTSGLSGAYGLVDQLRSASTTPGLTNKQSKDMFKSAVAAEKQFKALYSEADRLQKALDKAEGNLADMRSISSGIKSNLAGGFSLTDSIKAATDAEYVNGHMVKKATARSVSGAGMLSDAKAYQAKVKRLGARFKKLADWGASSEVLQEIASYGVDDALLIAESLSKSQVQELTGVFAGISSAAGYVGNQATRNYTDASGQFYAGGVYEAKAEVLGLRADMKDNNKEIKKQTNDLINALAKPFELKYKKGQLTSIVKKKALGGWITGPGTGMSDDVPIWASNGEFMVREREASKPANAALLERMNAGQDVHRQMAVSSNVAVAPRIVVQAPQVDYQEFADAIISGFKASPIRQEMKVTVGSRALAGVKVEMDKAVEDWGGRV